MLLGICFWREDRGNSGLPECMGEKAGVSEEMVASLVMARATLHAAIEEEKAKLEAKKENRFEDTLARLEKANS